MKKILVLLSLLSTQFALADDGVFAINNVCVNFGCFTGDSAGLPITITQPGSYILTSNLNSASTETNVIEISSSDVSIDLNGFTITGPRTCTGAGNTLECTNDGMTADAIDTTAANLANLAVKNGFVKGFDVGVRLTVISGNVEHVHASENGTGIISGGIISDCIANRNFSGYLPGFLAALIKDSFANGNRTQSALGGVCSNVYFNNNGADGCLRYTNDSTCGLNPCM